MISDLAQTKSHASPLKHWFGIADMLLAACSVFVAVYWTWLAKGEGIAIVVTILLLLTATAFLGAYVALKRDWSGQWLFQIVGPAMVVFLLFGTTWAIGAFAVAAAIVWLALRKGNARKNAA